jgi:hypothetical protein
MSVLELRDLLKKFFGSKVSDIQISKEEEITCVLYDAFVFKCDLNERYGCFRGRLMMDSIFSLSTLFNKTFSLDSDEESVITNFRMIDEYCRLRLPDKFLKRYECTEGEK